MGGEEFAMLLPGRSQAAAASAEGLRQKIETLQIVTRSQVLPLTCSFGVAEWERGYDIDRLLTRADVALYAAKTRGRNRVVIADASLAVPDYDGAGRLVRSRMRATEIGAATALADADITSVGQERIA